VARRDLHIAEVDPDIEHGGDKGAPQHVRVHPRKSDSGLLGEAPQPPCGAVSVHPCAARGEQDRACGPFVDGSLEGAADRRR
jgi:hypothetical protein